MLIKNLILHEIVESELDTLWNCIISFGYYGGHLGAAIYIKLVSAVLLCHLAKAEAMKFVTAKQFYLKMLTPEGICKGNFFDSQAGIFERLTTSNLFTHFGRFFHPFWFFGPNGALLTNFDLNLHRSAKSNGKGPCFRCFLIV